jgi:hypothetical protein
MRTSDRPGWTTAASNSRRQRIDETGQVLPDIDATRPIATEDILIEGNSLAWALVSVGVNFVGEPSTVMFRKNEIEHVKPTFTHFDRQLLRGLMDVAIWLNLASRGGAVYLVDCLSSFRVHPEQQSEVQAETNRLGATESRAILAGAWDRWALPRLDRRGAMRFRPVGEPDGPWLQGLVFSPAPDPVNGPGGAPGNTLSQVARRV